MPRIRPVAIRLTALVAIAVFALSPSRAVAVESQRSAPPTWACAVGGFTDIGANQGSVATPATAPTAAAAPTSDLRLALGRLLAEHAFLTMETMRAVAFKSQDEGALRSGLDGNTADLTAAIEAVYGPAAGDRFESLWVSHIDALIAYARARASGDTSAAEQARKTLDSYLSQFSAFLAKANPHLDAKAEAAALRLHVTQLIAITDSNYARAYDAERAAFEHMFHMGDELALAIARQFPKRYTEALIAFSPRTGLRVTLDRLLGEHLVLAAETMRAGLAKTADAPAARQALAGNSADLEAAVATYYGAAAGHQFGDVWRAHVDAYISYIDAVAANDSAARTASLNQLHVYHDQIAAFLSSANPYLNAAEVGALIQRHVQALISLVDSTQAGDHEQTVATLRGAYAQTFQVGDVLALATARLFPSRFQNLKEWPPTSTHELPLTPDSNLPGIALIIGLALLVAFATVRRVDRAGELMAARSRSRILIE